MVILAIFPIILANIAMFRILAPLVKNMCVDGDDHDDENCHLKNSNNSEILICRTRTQATRRCPRSSTTTDVPWASRESGRARWGRCQDGWLFVHWLCKPCIGNFPSILPTDHDPIILGKWERAKSEKSEACQENLCGTSGEDFRKK